MGRRSKSRKTNCGFVAADMCRELELGNSIDVNWVLLFSSRPIYFSFFYFVDFITGF